MIALNPALLVAAANVFVGLGETGGNNRGEMVELFLREVRQPLGQPWCAAFVHHVGCWSHYDSASGTSSWPLPPTASCWELGEFARARGVLVTEPSVGDVFLWYSTPLKRFAHTGIVVGVDPPQTVPITDAVYVCRTVEGNTNAPGSRDGDRTLRKVRTLSATNGDRFIRWSHLATAAVKVA